MKHREKELDKNDVNEDKKIILKMHEVIKDGRKYMSETYFDGKFTITVNRPVLTPEEQKIRDKEVERRMVALYKSIVASGRGDIFKTQNK